MSANLIRKRRVFDEKLPDAVIRLARTGDSIRPVDTPQPPIRISNIPVTDSLPPDRPQGFSSAEAGYQNATQPVNGGIATDALKRISIPTETNGGPSGMQPTIRLPQSYQTVPSVFGGDAAPIEAPVIAASRDRRTQPDSPLIRTAENYNASMSAPRDFGQDKEGNQRTHGREGAVGRIESFLKGAWDNYSHGGSALSALMSGGASAANTNRNATIRLQRQQAENANEYGNQIQLAGEREKILDAQSQRSNRDAMTQKALNPAHKVTYKPNAQGQILRIEDDPQGGEPRVTIVSSAKKTVAPNVHEIDGRLKIFNPETRQFDDALDANGQPITSEIHTPVSFTIGGKTYKVSPNTAAMAQATGERFNISQAATESRFARGEERQDARDERRDQKQQTQDEAQRWKEASGRMAKLGALYKARDRARALANDSEAPNQDANAQTYQDLDNQIQGEEVEIQRLYPDQFEQVDATPSVPGVGVALGGQGIRQLKLKPAPVRSAPSGRTGKFYTRAQVQAYADKAFQGDYGKARANVEAEGFQIQ
jgi:hypothetical protein